MTTAEAYRIAGITLHANGMPTDAAIRAARRQVQRFFVDGDTRCNAETVAEIVSVIRYLVHDCDIGVARVRDRMDQIAEVR